MFTRFGLIKRSHILSQRGNNFLHAPWAGGVILVVCVIVAMLLANLPATADAYHHLLHMELGLWVDGSLFPESMTLEKFINDGLMVVFFFTVGLEIRREISSGQLSTPKKAIFLKKKVLLLPKWSNKFKSFFKISTTKAT
jgi:NhaA family Na+:H+ antiporter